ncbi:MAG: hypothetical protein ACKVTZ_22140, partial [Bacteroidia bacterium]
MKKVFLFFTLALAVFSMQAQNRAISAQINAPSLSISGIETVRGDGDTLQLQNMPANYVPDSLTAYNWQAPQWGQTSGHNSYGDLGWAERYDISTADSSVTILGVLVAVGGSVQASPTASTGNLNVRIYDEGAKENVSGVVNVSGYPNTILGEVQLPYTGLTLNNFNPAAFATPIQMADTFFAAAVLDAYAPTSTMDSLFIFLGIDGTRPSSDVFSSLTPTDTT